MAAQPVIASSTEMSTQFIYIVTSITKEAVGEPETHEIEGVFDSLEDANQCAKESLMLHYSGNFADGWFERWCQPNYLGSVITYNSAGGLEMFGYPPEAIELGVEYPLKITVSKEMLQTKQGPVEAPSSSVRTATTTMATNATEMVVSGNQKRPADYSASTLQETPPKRHMAEVSSPRSIQSSRSQSHTPQSEISQEKNTVKFVQNTTNLISRKVNMDALFGRKPTTIAPSPPSLFSHVSTPLLPCLNRNTDDWVLYIIFESATEMDDPESKIDWSVQNTKIHTLATRGEIDLDPDMQTPHQMKLEFMNLPTDARTVYGQFIEELQERKELRGRLLLMCGIDVEEKGKFVVRLACLEVSN
ncbi:hypothetical protein BJ508DRAFT_367279 [Ascobolus immersus RN42]|uniref:Uncharacterized protein n=1 Tax=Ascobolus immersus RN42 TaxID=1160509 RepID=A0A3N4HFN9_ASCIM|nr:hypothetical protein BJ508DRAFT_367279 [Ascobolus immersus RN42]